MRRTGATFPMAYAAARSGEPASSKVAASNNSDRTVAASVYSGPIRPSSGLAEGIESKPALEKLIKMGCDLGQGYYWSKPLPAPEVERFLSNHPTK